MKTSISHIPGDKQEELLKIVEIIKISSKGIIWVEKIILFWSYARWDFVVIDLVRDGNNTLEYKSDFDILVITRKPAQELNMRLSNEISHTISENKELNTYVWVIIEDIYHVNSRLEENRYFYLDIKREGILLYDSWKCKLKSARELTKKEQLEIKKEDYSMWRDSAGEFFIDYQNAKARGSYKIAVFYLHQATERYITAFLLVKTGYKPKSHDLKVLYTKIVEENKQFDNWFSLDEENYFELLRKAYVDSRYSKEYKILKKELVFLEEKIMWLKALVERLCKEEL